MDDVHKNIVDFGDRKVIELLADYQTLDPARAGGEGYTRTLTFEDGKLINRTYSPYTNKTAYYAEEEENFELPYEEVKTNRSLEGDSLFLAKGDYLGSDQVSSGERAQIFLNNLVHHVIVEMNIDGQIYGASFGENFVDESVIIEDNSKVDNVNFHVDKSSSSLKLKYTSKEKLDPKINIYTENSSAVFHGTRAYHLDRWQYAININGLDPNREYTYNLNGRLGQIKLNEDSNYTKIAVLADPQIGKENSGYKSIIDEISQSKYDLIQILGDLTDNGMDIEAYDMLLNKSESKGIYENTPLSVIKGNHDSPFFFQRISAPAEEMSTTYSFESGPIRFVVLNTDYYDPVSLNRQKKILLKAKEKVEEENQFLVVSMHKGIYTSGSHIDDSDVVALRKYFAPLFEEVGVDLVLQGHDHVYSRGFINSRGEKSNDDSPLYLTAGHGGSLKWYSQTNYKVGKYDPLLANYEFLDFTSTDKDWHRSPMYLEIEGDKSELNIKAIAVTENGREIVDSINLIQ